MNIEIIYYPRYTISNIFYVSVKYIDAGTTEPGRPEILTGNASLRSASGSTANGLIYKFQMNDTSTTQDVDIKFSMLNISTTITITYVKSILPICVDYEYFFTTSNAEYKILDNNTGKYIHYGLATAKPNQEFAAINLSAILRPFLSFKNFELSDIGPINNMLNITITDKNGTNLDRFIFYYDYTYKNISLTENKILNTPISFNTPMTKDEIIDITFLSIDSEKRAYLYFYKDENKVFDLQIPFNSNTTRLQYSVNNYIDLYNVNRIDIVLDGKTLYRYNIVEEVCSRYQILYINKYGAIDVFKKFTNVYKNYNCNRNYIIVNNKDTENVNITETSYKLSTEFITTDESIKFANELMLSPKMWLYDKQENKYTEVKIDDSNIEVKEFKNGLEIPNYNITVSEATKKIYR